jgi:hypothetical protein
MRGALPGSALIAAWTLAMPLTLDQHQVLPFECHEHNYGLRNILSAARAQERPGP